MFIRSVKDGFEYTSGLASPVASVPLGEFSFISALRWSPERQEFLLTGTPATGNSPNLATNDKGDLRLHRYGIADRAWTELYPGYAHDPVYSSEFGYAVHTGSGIAFIDDGGRVTREVKVGRFNWGAPALAVSPSGRDLSWVRWKSDDMKPRVERLAGETVECRSSVARYVWFSDDVLLARNGGLPFLLDLASGKTTAFAKTIRTDLAAAPSTPDAHRDLFALPNSKVWQWAGNLALHGDRAYFDLSVTEQRSGGHRFDGLVSVDLSGGDPAVHVVLAPHDRFTSFDVQAEGITFQVATYEGTTVVDRRADYAGPAAAFLAESWAPAKSSAQPNFGSHAPLRTVEG